MENCPSETILDYPPGVLFCFLVQGQNPNMFYNPAKHHFFSIIIIIIIIITIGNYLQCIYLQNHFYRK